MAVMYFFRPGPGSSCHWSSDGVLYIYVSSSVAMRGLMGLHRESPNFCRLLGPRAFAPRVFEPLEEPA